MTAEEFKKLLDKHDWYYNYSNGEYFRKGRQERNLINRVLKDHPEYKEIYESYKK